MNLDLIKKHEGFRIWPYRDSRGILTVWYGHNLQASGLCSASSQLLDQAAEKQLQYDTAEALDYLDQQPWFASLSPARQEVMVDMVYNLGTTKFGEFHNLIAALTAQDYAAAAQAMKDSDWARQVPTRAADDIAAMLSGTLPPDDNTSG